MSRLPGECWRTPRKQETKLSRRRALALLSSLSQLLSSRFRIKLCSNLCISQHLSGECAYVSCDLAHRHLVFLDSYS